MAAVKPPRSLRAVFRSLSEVSTTKTAEGESKIAKSVIMAALLLLEALVHMISCCKVYLRWLPLCGLPCRPVEESRTSRSCGRMEVELFGRNLVQQLVKTRRKLALAGRERNLQRASTSSRPLRLRLERLPVLLVRLALLLVNVRLHSLHVVLLPAQIFRHDLHHILVMQLVRQTAVLR